MFKLTIACITYNQEKYIAQALESFVSQKTNFKFKAIICDDCSTDNTQQIIKEYAKKYPEIIYPIFRTKNLGVCDNLTELYNICDTEYVALCEGDDYWTDSLKLQKQVDFLDANPDFSICFHPVLSFYQDNSQPSSIYPSSDLIFDRINFGLEDLLLKNFMQTNSVVYRWRFNKTERFSDNFPKDILPCDWFVHLLHAQKGKIGLINEVMAAYRKHSEGVWWLTQENAIPFYLKNGIQVLKFYKEVDKRFPNYPKLKNHADVAYMARELFDLYLSSRDTVNAQTVLHLCPEALTVCIK